MFTFTSFSIVVTCVSKNTRAFEWSFGVIAFRIRFVSTGMVSGSTLVDIWKEFKYWWSNDSNQKSLDYLRTWHVASTAWHLWLKLLASHDTLLLFFSPQGIVNVCRESLASLSGLSPLLTYIGITACCENTILPLFSCVFNFSCYILAPLLIRFV